MSIFDNATQVMIGNKEVQSIITSNGGVLYEKQSGDNYLLTLTSDKDILSYYDNDSALLTATLTNNGVGVQGEMVRFDGFLLDTPITRSITQNTETHVGNKYILSNIPITNLNKIFLNKEHTVYITKDAVDGVMIHWPNGGSGDETSNISVENGIITYSRGGTTYTEDCSSYDMGVVYSQVSGFSINDYGVFAVTDSSGVATVSYESKGTGDLNIKCSCPGRMLVSEIYSIEDCMFYGINTNAFIIPSSTTFTSDGSKITAKTNTSGEKIVYFDHTFSNSDNWLFETELAQIGIYQSMAIVWNDNSFYGANSFETTFTSSNWYSEMNGRSTLSHYPTAGDKYIVRRENGVTSTYLNDDLIQSKTISHKSTFKIGYFINPDRIQYYKNIKIKRL